MSIQIKTVPLLKSDSRKPRLVNEYEDYTKDKRIIFVGGSPILKGRQQGDFINDYDVIVKTNGSLYLNTNNYYSDYGKRIDVLYTNMQFYRNYKYDLFKLPSYGVKYLRMKGGAAPDVQQIRKVINVKKIYDVIMKVKQKVESPLMGCFIIQDILDCKPKELYITGIDFFTSKKQVFEHNDYSQYIEGYLPDKIVKEGNIVNKGKLKDGHNQKSNTKFIYDLYKEGKLNMPDFIKELMFRIIESKEPVYYG